MRAILLFIGCGMILSMAGCLAEQRQSSWVQSRGGLVQDDRLARAEAALEMLGQPADRAISVRVLDSDVVCAYGWPNGQLFVTRALVDLLDEPELAAALAHEMGHLLNDGRMHSVVSLRGCDASMDIEAGADATGTQLLAGRNLSRDVMIQMLEKVGSSPSINSDCRRALVRRIQLLRARNF